MVRQQQSQLNITYGEAIEALSQAFQAERSKPIRCQAVRRCMISQMPEVSTKNLEIFHLHLTRSSLAEFAAAIAAIRFQFAIVAARQVA